LLHENLIDSREDLLHMRLPLLSVLLAGGESSPMKLSRRSLAVGFVTAGLTLGGAVIVKAQDYPPPAQQYPPPGAYAGPDYPAPYNHGLRGLIDKTQNDLRVAEEQEHQKEDQRERYQHAQGHLSTLDRDLSKGKFGKSELDKSIDSIRDILKHNVLTPPMRDALRHDLDSLEVVRTNRHL
jgi:hypothetical protein